MVALRRKVRRDGRRRRSTRRGADVTRCSTDGRRVHVRIEHAIGSLQRPLTDAQLDAKFAALVDPVLGAAKVEAIGRRAARSATRRTCERVVALSDGLK